MAETSIAADLDARLDGLDAPLRGETYSAEQLQKHAAQIAANAHIGKLRRVDRHVIDRFESNSRFVAQTYQVLAEAVRAGEPINSDAEWVLDNYYVVEEQLREIREDLPRRYYHELPKLTAGPWAGYPRVYEIAHELILHTDSSLDEDLIAGFVLAYQQITPLTSGEIWAVPIMLRLALIENLRRLCGHLLATRNFRLQARTVLGAWQAEGLPGTNLSRVFDCPTLVMQLVEELRDAPSGGRGEFRHEFEQWSTSHQEAINDCVRSEQHRLAANQVTIGNLITSMRLITALDWSQFFERVSLVEQILRQDPAAVYGRMDFATRDRYRHVIERLAKRSRLSEIEIASQVMELADEADRTEASDLRRRHVGFYLIDEGQRELERSICFQPPFSERVCRLMQRFAAAYYLGGISLGTLLGMSSTFLAVAAAGGSLPVAAVFAALTLLPASELAVGIVNLLTTRLLAPKALPKLEFSDRIPPQYQTLVVVPGMLTGATAIRRLVDRLEVHYLSNPESGMRFALLSDFADAPSAEMPDDAELLALATAGIRELNRRYPTRDQPRFLLLHRRREWNEQERAWMGWERKRGKLIELNALIRGEPGTGYLPAEGTLEGLSRTRYVITLDADTRLPHGAARRLIGTMAHPLNHAWFDKARGRVTRGYGVLQPRVGISLSSASRSHFARISTNNAGLDPYCTASSDVYQDLFGEGSYTGKGIYDVDAFSAAVDEAFPQNQILSHDLVEGCFARAGLVSDVEVFDDFPARFDSDARRQHRWVRGDWQIARWLMPRVPTAHGTASNCLSAISRWKIADNLRRSLLAPGLMLLLLAGWFAGAPFAGPATVAAVGVVALPLVLQLLNEAAGWHGGETLRAAWRASRERLSRTLLQCGFLLMVLPYRAQIMVDAIARTLWRQYVSHRRMLEWETAEAAERRLKSSPWSTLREMGPSSLAGLVLAALLPRSSWPVAGGLLALWCLAPVIAHLISRPLRRDGALPGAADRRLLRSIGRLTWAYFETNVGPEDHWLPPDNLQEVPRVRVARRVSPTNEGLFVASAVAARDFGYVGLHDLCDLLERNLDGFERLERYAGHVYNWFDTTTLTPLLPRYISTADNGNLAGCFLVAAAGLRETVACPVLNLHLLEGLHDALEMVEAAAERFRPEEPRALNVELEGVFDRLHALRAAARGWPDTLRGRSQALMQWQALAEGVCDQVAAFERAVRRPAADLSQKAQLLRSQLAGHCRDARALLPWTTIGGTAAGVEGDAPPSIPEGPWSIPWNALWNELARTSRMDLLGAGEGQARRHLDDLRSALPASHDAPWRPEFDLQLAQLEAGLDGCGAMRGRLLALADRLESHALAMDFTLLYNPQRRLFAVGYNLDDQRLDRSHYDLLASEARLASLIAIAKGDVDHRHWFQLGRALTEAQGARTLLSWGGTMFEYLMPTLFTRDTSGSLLDQSCRAAVRQQMAYGRQHGIPWGVSESAFAAQASNLDYHYQSFGVPGLGLKRGLARDQVVSPYSTALALGIDPPAAAANLRTLIDEGALGPWGLYDALDFTQDRVPAGQRCAVVRCYMAHHHGMTLVALANCLMNNVMRDRFQSQPTGRAIELLLQEQIPESVLEYQPDSDEAAPTIEIVPRSLGPVSRRLSTAMTATPRAHLLSNGRYLAVVTNSGGGYSSCDGIAVTRWRPDATRDCWGQFIYLRDMGSGRVWSAGLQPVLAPADSYEVTYSLDKAGIRRRDGDLETLLEVAVSPEHNAEVRQVTINNHGRRHAALEITSYAEVVLTSPEADAAHPAFSKLFIETEFVADRRALLARRRPRQPSEKPVWAVHILALTPGAEAPVEFESDRARFLGRNRSIHDPAALDPGRRLWGAAGAVLDPILSLRTVVNVGANSSASLAFITAFAESRDEALLLADQYHDPRVVQRTFELAWAHSQVELRHQQASAATVQLYQRAAAALLYPDPALRAPATSLAANRRGQSALWKYGISGDLPIVLLRITEPDQRPLLQELLHAHDFWRRHGLRVDLVVWGDSPAGYFDALFEQLLEVIHANGRAAANRPGGAYLLRSSAVADEDRALLEAVSSISLCGDRGTLATQLEAVRPASPTVGRLARHPDAADATFRRRPLPLFPKDAGTLANGYGSFDEQANEYVIRLSRGVTTPLPWSNVIANETFGFLVTESGGGYTWAQNSRENKLTSWSNDPVGDLPGEMLYLRDEVSGDFWSPVPQPARGHGEYVVRHGRGYSVAHHSSHGIHSELLLSIAPRGCIKFACLRLRNETERARTISATYYADWVLGVSRERTQFHIQTDIEPKTGAILARNAYHEEFPRQVAFLHVLRPERTVTGDRGEFFGRNGDPSRPRALGRAHLSGAMGAGLDPCGALQTRLTLAPGQEEEVVFLLGQVSDESQLTLALEEYARPTQVAAAIDETRTFWQNLCGQLTVHTPNRALDVMLNGWLIYQTLSCRIWGRSAFYQSGGAFGFRDQLQDCLALVYALPQVAREHLLRAASRQFVEGDVQHWWHPPAGRGVRTRFSDDYLWLPFAVAHYVRSTGDASLLDEPVGYLQSPPLAPEEHERYELPDEAPFRETMAAHCVRAIEHGCQLGSHGLPLMGGGDWNDGMNWVGAGGQGESVWVAWFLKAVLEAFFPILESRGDHERAASFQRQAAALAQAIENNAWDGAWYRRAYFDDGSPLGSARNEECQIDSLAQSWAVIAGGDPIRARQALHAVDRMLVMRDERLVKLFDPPFDHSEPSPGYIQGYLPGIRENGGQYTHAALWVVQALALQGDGDRAMELLDLLNPAGCPAARVDVYRGEPYAVAADVYSQAAHRGRAGWTWYTGSAAWMYRVALESILGFELRGTRLSMHPCLPADWPGFAIELRRGTSLWTIRVQRSESEAAQRLAVDGCPLSGDAVEVYEDGQPHVIDVWIERAALP